MKHAQSPLFLHLNIGVIIMGSAWGECGSELFLLRGVLSWREGQRAAQLSALCAALLRLAQRPRWIIQGLQGCLMPAALLPPLYLLSISWGSWNLGTSPNKRKTAPQRSEWNIDPWNKPRGKQIQPLLWIIDSASSKAAVQHDSDCGTLSVIIENTFIRPASVRVSACVSHLLPMTQPAPTPRPPQSSRK